VTVLGGLLSSTLLNVFFLPALAQRYIRRLAQPSPLPSAEAPGIS